jgi:entericidin B
VKNSKIKLYINLEETLMKTLLKTLLLSFAIITVTSSLNACNTVKGFGQDMSAGGHSLQKAADDNKS